MSEGHAFDTAFADMVRGASAGHESQIVDLARVLRSDYPLGASERELLARLVTELLPKGRGRPSRPRLFPAWQRDAAIEYLDRTDNSDSGQSEAIAAEISARLNVGRSTFFDWVATVKETIERLDEMGLPGREILRKGNQSN